ncbi:hypothetical protein ACF0H5_022307 [Mactra antiquata]
MKLIWKITCLFIGINIIKAKTINVSQNIVHLNSKVITGFYNNAPTRNIDTYVVMSLSECIEKCKRLKGCEYFNYVRNLNLCIPVYTSDPGSRRVRKMVGTLYGNKSEWDTSTIPSECETCSLYGECITEPTLSCVKTACARPYVPETSSFGNIYSIGGKVKFECNTINLSVVKVCQENEEWSNNNFTCTPPEPVCTSQDGISYSSTTLNDSTTLVYYISFIPMERDEAMAFCNTNCGRLVQILTMPKYEFLASTLQHNIEYRDDSYFIDGSFDDSEDKWFTVDGEEISKSMQFWDGTSGYDGLASAWCLQFDMNFRLDDCPCGVNRRFICEQV